ncbi:hypothetical protein T484DRAFT_1851175 [Baffinella frigidus]|nr:hypothetical protein T484DRAFT_1851175 [Cryptophyta sp. CCMP2293]
MSPDIPRPDPVAGEEGPLALIKGVAGEEGPMALMKGVTPRCLYLGPLSAVVHTIYEKIGKQMLLAKGPNWCHIAPAA